MTVRCEYCGQLYEGLSCPHCLAPRTEYSYDDELPGVLEGIKNTCDPEWTDDCVSVFYADNLPYFVGGNEGHAGDKVVYYPPRQHYPSGQETGEKHRGMLRWTVITIICAWFHAFSFGVLIGNSIGLSIGVATVFCVGIGCCFAAGYEE